MNDLNILETGSFAQLFSAVDVFSAHSLNNINNTPRGTHSLTQARLQVGPFCLLQRLLLQL